MHIIVLFKIVIVCGNIILPMPIIQYWLAVVTPKNARAACYSASAVPMRTPMMI